VRDNITGFDASQDVFSFSGVSGLTGSINFLEAGGFTAGGGSEARLVGNILQIDIDGNGAMTAADMEIELTNLGGILTNDNFSLLP
ncbi:MAG: hypothetical protein Q8L92_15870, partial [Rubrivivax sp.]|nr:hypothetical protein [Rubrivivax sp.]